MVGTKLILVKTNKRELKQYMSCYTVIHKLIALLESYLEVVILVLGVRIVLLAFYSP
jgi:hypothetical protein